MLARSRIELVLLIGFVVFACQFAYGARILGVFPAPSVSHQVIFRALMMELARRGHQLVVVTPDPMRDLTLLNYTEIDISFMYKNAPHLLINLAIGPHNKTSLFDSTKEFLENTNKMSEVMLNHEVIHELIDPNNAKEHFDLIFVEWFAPPFLAALSHRFSAPMIGIASLPTFSFMQGVFGNPDNPSYITDILLPYTDQNRTFLQRFDSLLFNFRCNYYFYNTYLPRQDEITKHYFGPGTPYISDLLSQVSMVFMNAIEGYHPPRPNVPPVVYINGFDVKTPQALPQDIQKFLDSSPKGAIYFSLGSNVRSADLPTEIRNAFLEASTALPDYHVLWKFEEDNLPGQPANVRTVKWAPQQDVLRHPKIKVFVTQGGLQSTEEAISAKVPLIGIPFCCDQYYNMNLGEDKGVAIRLDVNEINTKALLGALRKIIEDKSYAENMRRLSALVSDQQNTPMERAVWWTEYVLRHKGAAHLRTTAVDMPWYSYLLLDVVLFLLVTVILAAAVCWVVSRFLWSIARRLLFPTSKHKIN